MSVGNLGHLDQVKKFKITNPSPKPKLPQPALSIPYNLPSADTSVCSAGNDEMIAKNVLEGPRHASTAVDASLLPHDEEARSSFAACKKTV